MDRRELVAIDGGTVRIPDPDGPLHLQFRRFAGCPVCNLHLRSVAARHDEIVDAGVREVVVFHSSVAELCVHAADLPFPVIADPRKLLYREFGVESGPRAILDPRAWGPILHGVARDLLAVLRHRQKMPLPIPEGGRLGLPADFLLDADGQIVAHRYGTHVYDQWSVDEILTLAAR